MHDEKQYLAWEWLHAFYAASRGEPVENPNTPDSVAWLTYDDGARTGGWLPVEATDA